MSFDWRRGLEASAVLDLPVPSEVRLLCDEFARDGHRAFLVGGGVRDLLAGRSPSTSWDLATSATIREIVAVRRDARTDNFSHSPFTYAILGSGGCVVEMTPLQDRHLWEGLETREECPPVCTLAQDLRGRDYTVNAMAFDPLTGELFDPVGGRLDLEHRLLRAASTPSRVFSEDPVRAFRGVRIACKLGFDFEDDTRRAIEALPVEVPAPGSNDALRMSREVHRMLSTAQCGACLEMLVSLGLMERIVPGLAECIGCPDPSGEAPDLWAHLLEALRWVGGGAPEVAWGVVVGAAAQARSIRAGGAPDVVEVAIQLVQGMAVRLDWRREDDFEEMERWCPRIAPLALAHVAAEAVVWPQNPYVFERARQVTAFPSCPDDYWARLAEAWYAARVS